MSTVIAKPRDLRIQRLLYTRGMILTFCLLLAGAGAPAQTYTVLHHFGTNLSGVRPHGALVQSSDGTFYGITEQGGVANSGLVFKINPDGTGYAVLKEFRGMDGSCPMASLLLSGSTLYGTTSSGGSSNYGTVFRLNTDGTGFAVLKNFTGTDGTAPYSALVISDTTLFGTTSSGGSSNLGTVFRIGTGGENFAVIRHFLGDDGAMPLAGLCVGPSGVLYGTTRNGGSNGTVYAIGPDGGGFKVLNYFDKATRSPVGALLLSGDTLYGTTLFGTNDGLGGTVFKINVDGSGFTVLKNFIQVDGLWPNTDLVLSGDTLYGWTYLGGAFNCGVVFAINTNGGEFSVIKDFTTAENGPNSPPMRNYWSGGLVLSGGMLYGSTPKGQPGEFGSLFQLATDGSGFALIKQFTGGDGAQPYAGLAEGSDGALYGTTYIGGSAGLGTIYRLNRDGSGYTMLRQFSGADGSNPEAGLALSSTNLYGTAISGGPGNYGVLFRTDTNGASYDILKAFSSYDDGVFPTTVPVISANTLYGGVNYGKIFRINTDGSGYGFMSVDVSGGLPRSILLDGSTVYGTEQEGGPSYYDGMVFKISTDGSGFTILKSMGGTHGSWPNGPLVLYGDTLYGTAYAGGNYSSGTVFKLNTNGSGFGVLKQFNGTTDGGFPYCGLVLRGNTLYGTTGLSQTGADQGTIFRINKDGTGFTVVRRFSGPDGKMPFGPLISSGTNIFGTTMYGGAMDQGVIFSLVVPPVEPVILSSPRTQTAEVGSTVYIGAKADGIAPLGYMILFNYTNVVGVTTNGGIGLFNVQPEQAGVYQVVVTNSFGVSTSTPAVLQVIPAVERRPVPAIGITAQPGSVVNLVYTSELSAARFWTSLDSVRLADAFQWYFDLAQPLPVARFYRAWQIGGAGQGPVLNPAAIVPAITLSSQNGHSQRLDYINAIGPTDAWVTLDTLALSNSSQLYFDTSSIGQPRRLYRIVPLP